MRSQERLPDYQAMTVWCTSELPVNNDESAFNNGEAGPKGQRVLLRIGEMGPDAHSASVMHRTETLDYAVVLAGTCDMELDHGARIRGLKAGDVVIQRGTNPKWIVRGSAPGRFLFVLHVSNQVPAGHRILGRSAERAGGN